MSKEKIVLISDGQEIKLRKKLQKEEEIDGLIIPEKYYWRWEGDLKLK